MKKLKYIKIKNFLNQLSKHQNHPLVICHNHYFNAFDFLKIRYYCLNNNVVTFQVYSGLIKKLFKNKLFWNLLSGPTRFFFFSDLTKMRNFFSLGEISEKIIPLIIYWNNNFYEYNFFISYLKKNKLDNLKSHHIKTSMITYFKPFFVNILNMLYLNQKKIFSILKILKSS